MALADDIAADAPVRNDPRAVFADYERYLARAQSALAGGDLDSAAVFAAIAAHMALRPHPGFFAAPRLEKLLLEIGRRTSEPTAYKRIMDPSRKIHSILHVATELTPVGGLTNMLGRWIAADKKRLHSVALTAHRGPLHGAVASAVDLSGGRVIRLNKGVGGIVEWSKRLRSLARQHDAVVLHAYSQDVIASIAFANPATTPPVMLLNHGDHLFWLGVSTSDVVINLRDAAQDLSIARRGVEPRRNVMVPTIVEPPVRTRSREQAKRELGIASDTIMLFSAARGMKYRSVNGRTFADPHVELLQRHPHAALYVLGAGDPPDWRGACAATDGRIKPLPESPNTKLYYEAADIYVDSFPFVSSTSMMEAAGLGTPLVSRFYGPREARIFAINHPGIDAPTLHGDTEAEYVRHLDALIGDPDLRARKGEEARQAVLHYHTPPSWLDFIEKAYALAASLPPIDPKAHLAAMPDESFHDGEPDCRLYEVFGFPNDNPARLMKAYLGLLPSDKRLAFWQELRAAGAFTDSREAVRGLLPDWLVRAVKDRS
ncbi:MAG: glycosyl transferase family 1 [Hyphomonadaceae bacterium]